MITITGLDIETTGFKAEDGHRITEIAMTINRYDPFSKVFTHVGKFHRLINPKRVIPSEVQSLTGITPAMVAECPVWEDVAPAVGRIIRATDIFVAHNADFDSVFLGLELHRVGEEFSPHTQVYCTMQNGRFATPLGKPPKLVELCQALDIEFDTSGAHRADYDTDRMMEALHKGSALGYFDLTPAVEAVRSIKTEKVAA